ncbi:hypothetical protein GCM10009530_04550 [Microbispora corallina]|uniref:Secreted protein n=1 Tax=Microbispora corallina TaxID=83302 RepID=A0ABQ4FR90_9ACTN|nr:hypothetical protein Mco01_03180 [Microbispora corallina]
MWLSAALTARRALVRWRAALLSFTFLFETAFAAEAVFVEAVLETAVADVSVATLVTVTVTESAAAGWVPTAPTDAVKATPPRVMRARRDRLAGVVDRISPRFFRLRLPG